MKRSPHFGKHPHTLQLKDLRAVFSTKRWLESKISAFANPQFGNIGKLTGREIAEICHEIP